MSAKTKKATEDASPAKVRWSRRMRVLTALVYLLAAVGLVIAWRTGYLGGDDRLGASTDVQIDHVVPLGEAWRSGASGWKDSERAEFANDLRNLLAVDGPTNQGKGDDDPAHWLPPQESYRCQYVGHYVDVKYDYRLHVDTTERRAIVSVLVECPEQSGALAKLRKLAVAPETTSPKYVRARFGSPWRDVDGNHCNQRDDVLARDLQDVRLGGRCVVLAGTLEDPYTGKTIHFTRTTTAPTTATPNAS